MKIFDVDFIAYWIVLSSIHYNLSNAWLPQYHNTLAYIMIHHHISRRAVILSKLLNEKDPLDGNNGFSHAQNLVLTYLFQGQLFSPRCLGKQNWIWFKREMQIQIFKLHTLSCEHGGGRPSSSAWKQPQCPLKWKRESFCKPAFNLLRRSIALYCYWGCCCWYFRKAYVPTGGWEQQPL